MLNGKRVWKGYKKKSVVKKWKNKTRVNQNWFTWRRKLGGGKEKYLTVRI